jgi:threonine dehydrogenase-like Zn-dependent dehydrogenase
MKAIIKEKEGVFLRDIPIPKIGNSEVLIKVAVVAYCRTDGYVAQDKIKTEVPLILGHEFSGVIEDIGSSVSKFKTGDRVAVMPILKDTDGYYTGKMLGVDLNGAFAEYVAVPEDSLYHIPEGMSFVHAAYLEPVAASLSIVNVPSIRKGRGFILGKNRIANLTKRIAELEGLGSIDIIPLEKLKSISDNEYDFCVETIATTDTLSDFTRIIKPGGTIVLKSRQYSPVEINVKKIVQKDLKLIGTQYGDFQMGMDLVSSGKLKVDDFFEVLEFEAAVQVLISDSSLYEEKKLFFNTRLCAE